MSILVAAFRPMRKHTLRGFVDVTLPVTRLMIRDVAIHQVGDRCWINLPSRPMLNKDGSPVLNDRGKPLYFAFLRFTDEAAHLQFERAVIAAVRATHPQVLGAAEEPRP
ncbi:MAG TPA: hypothetical protein VFL55_09900 [Acetobacteraceae bacterium]|nr:hypothetical protein [Acetobacteraceae bacterium]